MYSILDGDTTAADNNNNNKRKCTEEEIVAKHLFSAHKTLRTRENRKS